MALSARSDIELIDPSIVPSWVSDMVLGQSFQFATASILVYDAITTMDKEVKYFWKSPRKFVNIAYFLNRYIGILSAVSYLAWNSYRAELPLLDWITGILIEYILMIRVLALYAQDKLLRKCLWAMLGVMAGFRLGILIQGQVASDVVVARLANNVTVCGFDGFPPWQWGVVDWILPMVYELVLLVLVLYKTAEYWKMSAGLRGFQLVKVLIQDQVIYFLLVLVCTIINIVNFRLETSIFLTNILDIFGSPALLCILGSRMLINLKEAGELGLNGGTSYRTRSASLEEMEFA